MKYLKIYEASKKTNWIEIQNQNSKKIINDALKQNPDIKVDDVSDVLLEMFDFLGYYPKPEIRLHFKGKLNTQKWDCRIDSQIYDISEESYAKSDYYWAEKFLSKGEYGKTILVIVYGLWSLYEGDDDNDNNWFAYKEMEKSYLKKTENSEFEIIKNECYERLHSMGYKTTYEKFLDENPTKGVFYIYKEISYKHTSDTDYLNGLPENIIKDFHQFVIDTKLTSKNTKALIDIFKKGFEK